MISRLYDIRQYEHDDNQNDNADKNDDKDYDADNDDDDDDDDDGDGDDLYDDFYPNNIHRCCSRCIYSRPITHQGSEPPLAVV